MAELEDNIPGSASYHQQNSGYIEPLKTQYEPALPYGKCKSLRKHYLYDLAAK
jgi:hypothetical protein